MKELKAIGLDLAKNVFQLHGVDGQGHACFRRRVSRAKLLDTLANLPSTVIAMEACGGSNYWGQQIQALGHQARLIAAQHVKPYLRDQKNDYKDAEAICEAVTRPRTRFVPIKQPAHQQLSCLLGRRAHLVRQRTALINELRSHAMEFGVVLPQGRIQFEKQFVSLLDNPKISIIHEVLEEGYSQYRDLRQRIGVYDRRINAISSNNETCRRLKSIPGIGAVSSVALFATAADSGTFKNGRHFAAWIGLVPRQHSSGQKLKLLGITKRGQKALRTLLVHGARAVIRYAKPNTTQYNQWILDKCQRRGKAKAIVALANKNARIAWAVLVNREPYHSKAA